MMVRSSHVLRVFALVGAVAVLSGCESLRDAAGMSKSSPDEFAVLTKAPLVVPPDYNLRPPKPGAPPTNQVEPGDAAASSLFGSNDPVTVAATMTGDFTEGEKLLLARAGAANVDPAIREHLAADQKGMVAANKTFTDKVLFWEGPKQPAAAKPVDADAEARRIDAQKAGDQKPGDQSATPPPPKQEDKGWFDGWFDWL